MDGEEKPSASLCIIVNIIMPAKLLMSWQPSARRWWKQYKGRRYVVSCRQLNALGTKEGSYQAANAWWTSKQAEIDGRQPPHPYANTLDNLSQRRQWCIRHGEPEMAAIIAREIGRIENGGVPCHVPTDDLSYLDDVPSERVDTYREDDEGPPPEFYLEQLADEEAARAIDTFDPLWNDRIRREEVAPIASDRTVGRLVDEWLSLKRTKVEAGGLSPKGYDNTVDCINYFRDWIGAGVDVETVDAKRWQGYWIYLSARISDGKWSRDYTSKVFRTARTFIEWLDNADVIRAPRNLKDRELRFGTAPKAVPTMTVEEVKRLVANATGQLKLHLLLMANCGMTQKDVADLRPDEVDWQGGRITRKRSKTKYHPNVPTVNYRLWPVTFDLLRDHKSNDPERVLLTKSGRPWVYSRLIDGKLRSTDTISTIYGHLQKKLDFDKSIKLLRKTSASLLDHHPTFGRYEQHFLAQSPKTVRDKHYVTPSQSQFDEAITWLGHEYGLLSASDQGQEPVVEC